jgi:Peptidase family M23/Domain of unknown function (DUF4214)
MTRITTHPRITKIAIVLMMATTLAAAFPQIASAQTSAWWVGGRPITQGYGCTSYYKEPLASKLGHACPNSAPYWHTGIDIGFGGACGTPLYAAEPVRVDAIGGPDGGTSKGFGPYYPTLRLPDGHDMILGHVQPPVVLKVGQDVPKGQLIAYVGSEGNSSGCHVHFEVRPGGAKFGRDINPSSYLNPQPSMSGGDATAFADQAYHDLLGRPPDSAGLAAYVPDLEYGMTTTRVAASLLASHEYVNDQVTALYWKLLGRAPDSAGLAGWDNLLQNGGTYEQVKEGMMSSAEYLSLAGGTNTAVVTKMYRDILDRAPDPSGLATYVHLLEVGTSRQTVATDIVTSKEAYTGLVTGWYHQFLRRAPDSDGLTIWVNDLQGGHTDHP